MIEIIPTWLYTPLICIAMGGLLMAAIMVHKKKLAIKLAEAQAREAIERRNADLAEKYRKEHPEEFQDKGRTDPLI